MRRNRAGNQLFFEAFGFTREAWQTLPGALLDHAVAHEVSQEIVNLYGVKYVQICN